MPCQQCDNGKWKWGRNGNCVHGSKADCEAANRGRSTLNGALVIASVLAFALIFTAFVRARGAPPSATIGASFSRWASIGPQDRVTLTWDRESGVMSNPPLMSWLGADPLWFHDMYSLHADGDSCIYIPQTRNWTIYAEVVFELDEQGTRTVFLTADGGIIDWDTVGPPNPFFQMRASTYTPGVPLVAGQCIEVRAQAEGHGDGSELGVKGGVFAVW